MRTIGLLFYALGSFLSHLLRYALRPISKGASFVNYMFTRYYTGKFDEPAMQAFFASSALFAMHLLGLSIIFVKIFKYPAWLVEATKLGGGGYTKKALVGLGLAMAFNYFLVFFRGRHKQTFQAFRYPERHGRHRIYFTIYIMATVGLFTLGMYLNRGWTFITG